MASSSSSTKVSAMQSDLELMTPKKQVWKTVEQVKDGGSDECVLIFVSFITKALAVQAMSWGGCDRLPFNELVYFEVHLSGPIPCSNKRQMSSFS